MVKKVIMRSLFYVIFILSFSLVGCSDDDQCKSGPLDIITMADLGCEVPPHQISIKSTKEFELIRNEEQFQSLLISPCRPNIDWAAYDMIAGSINLQNGLVRLEHGAYYNCQDNKLAITITVFLNDAAVALPVGFAFLIPKLHDTETPYVSIVTQQ